MRWFEVSTRPDPCITPASAKTIETWQAAGLDVHAQVINGPTFWQTAEIEVAPSLLPATVAAVLASACCLGPLVLVSVG